ncbi:dipeptide/oligopeptide/nickel ABC transporter permease/ATP-binding protein [Amycolatopsis palatopharyngis]|uniref:dipeptide/oligopeptide/nickel ABC transporter permease/ATP-binding protein n=1 Tax=Amycolatopsis palatopharyngis TaxID=187982 RepID=UPI000E27CADD|nr:dipeptide/oligopeptide/nickel ABC transporter permease/ATP-binding protein [Amycolatopsis palatopharyngis]
MSTENVDAVGPVRRDPETGETKTGVAARLAHAWMPFRRASRVSRVLIFSGLGVVVLFLLAAFIGPLIYEFGGTQYRVEVAPGEFEPIEALQPPSGEHPLGTTRDQFDVLARIIDGASLAFTVMALAVSIAMIVGVTLGLLSGYRGGPIDRVLVTVMDSVYAFPPLILAIIVGFALSAIISPGVVPAAAAVGIVYIPQYFRVVRNHTLSVKQEPFVEAARSMGAKERTVLGRYVFFNVVQTVPVILTLNAADSILVLASLGFLGYGVPPPTAEWGYDISRAITDVPAGVWWTALWPGLAIVILVTALTLLGEGLNDVINPLLRSRGKTGPKIEPAPREDMSAHDGAANAVAGAADTGLERWRPSVSVRDLRVGYRTPDGPLWAVDGVDFDVYPGESLGLVGESGCGKTSLGRALMRLMPPGGVVRGKVEVAGEDMVGMSESRVRKKRGEDLGLVFQEPMTRLNPLMKISDHFIEMIRTHQPGVSRAEALARARTALSQMGIPPTRVESYPHEFSGGMRQRAMIALSIVLEPRVIVADEPTTALDVIVESQILDLFGRLRSEEQIGLLLVTHNLGLVAETCDRVAVMYAGKIVEIGPVDEIFNDPKHPYTRGLLASTISLETTELQSIDGYPPNLIDPPPGCRFASRCPYVMEHCTDAEPQLTETNPEQRAACYLYPGAGAPVPEGVRAPAGNPQETGV